MENIYSLVRNLFLITLVFSSVAFADEINDEDPLHWVSGSLTICKDGTCNFSSVHDAFHKTGPNSVLTITDGQTYSEEHKINVKRDNVILDCAGATITGSKNKPKNSNSAEGFEIRADNFEIKNCVISNYMSSINQRHNDNGARILNNTIKNFNYAITLNGENNLIQGNTITNGGTAIRLLASETNEIKENTIKSDVAFYFGKNTQKTSSALIYHNTIYSTTPVQHNGANASKITLDNGYPSGGNYWNTTSTADAFKGPNQNTPGADGIRDAPYAILIFTDKYPLAQPYSGEINVPPVANYTYTNSTNTNFAFTDASYDFDGTIASRSWDFGDGTTSTNTYPTHAFTANGAYNVTLTATDNEGATESMTQTITVAGIVPNAAPNASFSFVCANLSCAFTDASTDSDGTIASYAWNFNDSTSSTDKNPSHTFAANGNYSVSLTVTDDDGSTNSYAQTVEAIQTITPNAEPTANYTYSCAGKTCNFTDTSTDSDGIVASWVWNFNDSTSSTDENPAHTFALGVFNVTLTVTDNNGATNTHSETLTFTNVAPTANFTWSCINLTCTFTDASTDSDGTIASWLWATNGSTYATQNATHAFAQNGTYNVTLTATDNDGDNDSTTLSVTAAEGVVTNAPPVAEAGLNASVNTITAAALNGNASYDSDGTIALFEWDFNGDGIYDWNSTTTSVTTHVYSTAGVYNATLRVTDDDGAASTDVTYVTVTNYVAPSGPGPSGITYYNYYTEDKDVITANESTENITEEQPEENPQQPAEEQINTPVETTDQGSDPQSALTGFFLGAFSDKSALTAGIATALIFSLAAVWKAPIAAKLASLNKVKKK